MGTAKMTDRKDLTFEPISILYNRRDDEILRAGRRTIWGDLAPDKEGLIRAEQDQVPYTFGLFIQSKDGRAVDSLEGGVGRMSGVPSDRYGQLELRSVVDAFLVGGATLRADRTHGTPILRELIMRRKKEKGDTAPLNVFFSESGDIPADLPVFWMHEIKTAIFIGERAASKANELRILTKDVNVVSAESPLRDIWNVLYRRGVMSIGFEGGPKLMGMALKERLVHELLLSHSPLLLGGAGASFSGVNSPFNSIRADPLFIGLDESNGLMFERSRLVYG
jgi:riboflavin biosynthesis pyrimidine reductase